MGLGDHAAIVDKRFRSSRCLDLDLSIRVVGVMGY